MKNPLATNVVDRLRSSVNPATTPVEQANQRVADLDQQIRTVEAEHDKRLRVVAGLERDLEEATRQRRLMGTRRDVLGDPDLQAFDRTIAAATVRENDLRTALGEARAQILDTPELLDDLRDQKRVALVDQNNAERQACADTVWRAAQEAMDDEPVLRRMRERQRIVEVALEREERLRHESVVCTRNGNLPAPSIAPRGLWFGPDLENLEYVLQQNQALLRGR